MALVSRRYVLVGPTDATLAQYAPGVVNRTFPTTTLDISVENNAGAITTLDEFMATLGYFANNSAPVEFANQLSVATDGRSEFRSIKDACDAAIAAGASPFNPYQIVVSAGIYVEQPFTCVSGMAIAPSAGTSGGVIVVAANPAADLLTMNGGVITGINFSGVTAPGKACIRNSNPFAISLVFYCSFQNCANGWYVDGGATAGGSNCWALIGAPGQPITEAVITSDGPGSAVFLNGCLFGASPALLPWYATNPIQCCVRAINGASFDVQGTGYIVAPKDNTQVNVFCDSGSQMKLYSAAFTLGWTGIQIGAGGANSRVVVQGGTFANHVTNFKIDSATGAMFAQVSADTSTVVKVPGALFTGIVQDQSSQATDLVGNVQFEFPTGLDASVGNFIHTNANSGVVSGGEVTAAAGLTVNVAAGNGWMRFTTDGVVDQSWLAVAGLALAANATNYVYIDSATMLPAASVGLPPDSAITLAIVVTDGASVLYTHVDRDLIAAPYQQLFNYLIATRRITIKNGVVTSQGSTNRKLDITVGIYYRAAVEVPFAGVADATFAYFYNNGNTRVAAQTLLNITDYDNAGVLTAMTAGWYRADTVYVTSDGQVSVIYGTSQYLTLAQAEVAGVAAAPQDIVESACRTGLVIVKQGVGIAEIIDVRPNPDTTVTGAAGAPVTIHGSLLGLGADDHPQYLLGSGTRAMTGDLDMGGQSIVNVNLVDGVDVPNHNIRHQPGGIDAIATAAADTIMVGDVAQEGVAASISRSDHQHALPAPAAPVDVTKAAASAGVATTVARADHKHDVTTAAAVSVGAANAEGVATTLARSDHEHEVTDLALTGQAKGDVIYFDGVNWVVLAVGVAGQVLETSGPGEIPIWADGLALTAAAPVAVTKSAAVVGVSGDAARADHKHDITTAAADTIEVGDAAAEGVATSLARSDHQHALPAPAAPADVTKAAASAGVALTVARADHKHDVATAVAVTVGTANAEGVSASLSRADHVHNHGAQALGTGNQHAVATQLVAGFESAADKTKLDGIAAGATNTPLTILPPLNVTKAVAAAGVSTDAARADHKHDITTAAAVAVGTANAEGAAASLARSDHTHQVTGLAIAGQVQGDVLYFNGANWVRLPPGAAGQLLQTNGAAANPSWATLTAAIFGAWFQKAESLAALTTNGVGYNNKLTMVTPVLPAGDYLLLWSFTLGNTIAQASSKARVMVDGVTTLSLIEPSGNQANWKEAGSGQAVSTLTNAAHTFTIDFARTSGGTATIQDARLTIYRVA